MFFFYDRYIFLVSGTSQFCSYPSTCVVFLRILQHNDKVTSRRMLNAFDIVEFRPLRVFYMITQPLSNLLFQSANIFRFPVLSNFKSNLILSRGLLSWPILIFVYFCFFVVRLGLHRCSPTPYTKSPWNKFMNENIRAVEKTYDGIILHTKTIHDNLK